MPRMFAGVAALALAALVLTGCRDDLDVPAQAASSFNAAASAGQQPLQVVRPSLGQSVNTGLSGSGPYTILILGDSTGNGPDEWVHIMARRIASDYNRFVTVHNWSTEVDGYVDTTTYGKAGSPDVTIWNGSAAGMGPKYSEDFFPSMAPQAPDLTLINHGHNGIDPYTNANDEMILVDRSQELSTPNGVIAVILQNPRIDSPDHADRQQGVVNQLRSRFSAPDAGATIIDVNSAFPEGDAALATVLNPDGVHPNAQGQKLWADTVATSLELR